MKCLNDTEYTPLYPNYVSASPLANNYIIIFMRGTLSSISSQHTRVLTIDDGQQWQKEVKATFHIEFVALDGTCYPRIPVSKAILVTGHGGL
jgi:hypothetical protein